jgi:hypothetical protein
LPARQREGVLPHLVSFATGALLGAALLALIPHAVLGAGSENVHEVGIALIAGIALLCSRNSCSGGICHGRSLRRAHRQRREFWAP